MGLDAPTEALLASLAAIIVCCMAFPKVRRTLLRVVSTMDGIGTLLYILFGLAIVGVATWALVNLDWVEANKQLIAGCAFLIWGIFVMVAGRIDIGLSKDVTGLPARLIGLVAVIVGLVLVLPLSAG